MKNKTISLTIEPKDGNGAPYQILAKRLTSDTKNWYVVNTKNKRQVFKKIAWKISRGE